MLIAGIKSRPRYRPLALDPAAARHVVVGEGAGFHAVLRLVAEATGAGAASHVLLVRRPDDDGVALLPPGSVLCGSVVELCARLDELLGTLAMGVRLYGAGNEGFLSQVSHVGQSCGLDADEILLEWSGRQARRVYCIHCRALTEEVDSELVACSGCGRHLLVRDHYSRRLAAYMGVMADAETSESDPGEDV